MAMVGYPDRRKGREKGRHCKPGMSRTSPAVPADTSIRNATGRIVLRLCCYQQGYSRFTNVSIILRLYEAAVTFLLYDIFFIHSVRNIFCCEFIELSLLQDVH